MLKFSKGVRYWKYVSGNYWVILIGSNLNVYIMPLIFVEILLKECEETASWKCFVCFFIFKNILKVIHIYRIFFTVFAICGTNKRVTNPTAPVPAQRKIKLKKPLLWKWVLIRTYSFVATKPLSELWKDEKSFWYHSWSLTWWQEMLWMIRNPNDDNSGCFLTL